MTEEELNRMKCCGNKSQEADHVCNGICPNGYMFEPKYVVRYMCSKCGENVGYIGWLFTKLRIPFLKHECEAAHGIKGDA